jgi:dCMP deaminase
MGMAFWASRKSKDPSTQVGAYIVAKDNSIVSLGYNGPPARIKDKAIDWSRPHKHHFIEHAEKNAMWYGRNKDMTDATIYVTGHPCRGCALDIVQSGIKRVVYFPLKAKPGSMLVDPEETKKTKDIFRKAKVKLEVFKGDLKWMLVDLAIMREMGVFD